MRTDNTIVGHDICVRPAQPADFEQLHAVDVRVFGRLAYPYFTLRQLFDAFPECWLVAARPSGLVGYSLGMPSTDRSHAWLFGLAVDPRYRRLGCGRLLTKETLNLLGTMRVENVSLTVEPANEPAIGLYREFGFSMTEHRQDYFGPGEDRLVMTRRIQQHTRPSRQPASMIPSPRPDLAHDRGRSRCDVSGE